MTEVRQSIARVLTEYPAARPPQIENGLIRFPERAPWWDEYEYELISFPACKYYDQVDSTSQPTAITYYKMLLAQREGWTMEQVDEFLDAKKSVPYD